MELVEETYEHHFDKEGSPVRSPIRRMKLVDFKSSKDLSKKLNFSQAALPKQFRKKVNSPNVSKGKNLLRLKSVSESPQGYDPRSQLDDSIFSKIHESHKINLENQKQESFNFEAEKKESVKSKSKSQVSKGSKGSQFQENELCVICFCNPQNAVYMPCGHGSTCTECSLDILEKNDECCICREVVETMVEIDLKDKRNNCFRVLRSYIYFNEEHNLANGRIDHLEQIHHEPPEEELEEESEEIEEEEQSSFYYEESSGEEEKEDVEVIDEEIEGSGEEEIWDEENTEP